MIFFFFILAAELMQLLAAGVVRMIKSPRIQEKDKRAAKRCKGIIHPSLLSNTPHCSEAGDRETNEP